VVRSHPSSAWHGSRLVDSEGRDPLACQLPLSGKRVMVTGALREAVGRHVKGRLRVKKWYRGADRAAGAAQRDRPFPPWLPSAP
jgi:hypothetical protein